MVIYSPAPPNKSKTWVAWSIYVGSVPGCLTDKNLFLLKEGQASRMFYCHPKFDTQTIFWPVPQGRRGFYHAEHAFSFPAHISLFIQVGGGFGCE